MIDLYKDYTIQGKELLYKRAMEDFKEVYNTQNENNMKLKREVATLLLIYNILDEKLKLSRTEQNQIIKKLFRLIEQNSLREYHTEVNKLKSILGITAKDTNGMYYYIKSLGKDSDEYLSIPNNKINEIVESKIEGLGYEERIKENKLKNELKLKKIIQLLILGEITVNDINTLLEKQFITNQYISNRLAGTEITRVQAQTDEEIFNTNDTQKVLYLATLDFKTCEECASLDNTVYRVDDINRPEIPQHTNCRCCYCDIPDEDWRPYNRRDNRFVGKNNDVYLDYTSYENWIARIK